MLSYAEACSTFLGPRSQHHERPTLLMHSWFTFHKFKLGYGLGAQFLHILFFNRDMTKQRIHVDFDRRNLNLGKVQA